MTHMSERKDSNEIFDNPMARRGKDRENDSTEKRTKPTPVKIGNGKFFLPIMLGLLIIGALWLITYYVTGGEFMQALGNWNIAVGMGFILAGLLMATRWE